MHSKTLVSFLPPLVYFGIAKDGKTGEIEIVRSSDQTPIAQTEGHHSIVYIRNLGNYRHKNAIYTYSKFEA